MCKENKRDTPKTMCAEKTPDSQFSKHHVDRCDQKLITRDGGNNKILHT